MAGDVVVASAARTTSGSSGAVAMTTGDQLVLELEVTAQSGVGPTLDVSVEWSSDGGTEFAAAEPADAFGQVTAPTVPFRRARTFSKKGDHYRVVWALAGTTPSYTFEVRADYE